MPLTLQLALVPDGPNIDLANLTKVSGALSKQAQRDFAPIWGTDATVDAFTKLEDVPTDYWPIIVMNNVQDAEGYHEDKNGQPFSIVNFDNTWSLTASHECLEMLADPFGRRLRAADLLDQAVPLVPKPGRVRYLVEVCDPCEGGQFGYSVNGVQVSDFYTPEFFDPVSSAGVRYSFTGNIKSPRTVLDGGYISWEDPISRDWFQLRMFPDDISPDVPHVVNLSKQTNFLKHLDRNSLRSAVDMTTYKKRPDPSLALRGNLLVAARTKADAGSAAQLARAEDLRVQVSAIVSPRRAAKANGQKRGRKGKADSNT